MTTLLIVHVGLSLVGIVAGIVVAVAMLAPRIDRGWTATFLWSTLLTSLTGFLFPITQFTPALGFGIISLLVLAPVFFGLYKRKLAGHWRWIYVTGALFAFYLNFFVLIVQSFLKIPALHALAPTQQEPPFALAQGVTLIGFLLLGFLAVRRFKPEAK